MDNSNPIKEAIIKNLGELATKNEDQIFQLKRTIQEKEIAIIALQENLSAIHNSWAWKLITAIRKLCSCLFPLRSKRRALADQVLSRLIKNKH